MTFKKLFRSDMKYYNFLYINKLNIFNNTYISFPLHGKNAYKHIHVHKLYFKFSFLIYYIWLICYKINIIEFKRKKNLHYEQ